MVKVVAQSRVDFYQRQVVPRADFVHAYPHALVPNRDVLDGDAVPFDARSAADDAGGDVDVLIQSRC